MLNALLLTTFLAASLSSALPQAVPSPSCTSTVFGGMANGCTKYASTVTETSYTECNGCALTTFKLQHGGPVCTSVVSLTDTITATEIACAPTPTCTVTVPQFTGALSSATCTRYKATVTQTVVADCGGRPGCAVATATNGPDVSCGAYVTSKTTTSYATRCTS